MTKFRKVLLGVAILVALLVPVGIASAVTGGGSDHGRTSEMMSGDMEREHDEHQGEMRRRHAGMEGMSDQTGPGRAGMSNQPGATPRT